MSSRTIVFIHGLFVSKQCWDPWVARFESRGYQCLAIPYPERDAPVAELKRRHPDPRLAAVTLPEVLEHHVRVIQALPEKPVIMGHSYGGLLTQLLLQRGLGVAGVAISSVPPLGLISTKLSFLRSALPGLNPLIPASSPYYMTFPQFQYSFAHTLPVEEQRKAYDQQVVPESRRLQRAAISSHARVDFRAPRAPLLLVAAELDRIIPAALNRANLARYGGSPAVTAFKEFAGRTHYTVIAGEGWQEVADYALSWGNEVQADRTGGDENVVDRHTA